MLVHTAVKNVLNCNSVIREDTLFLIKDGKEVKPTQDEQTLIDKELLVLSQREELLSQQKAFNGAIQNYLDTKAQEFRYDNMMSARSYTGYINAFQAEAQALATWASECWVVAGEIEADVKAGNRDMPTVDEVLNELPKYDGGE